ncbi:LLM class flavin-dependent oxidoreductase [soil metagenome]
MTEIPFKEVPKHRKLKIGMVLPVMTGWEVLCPLAQHAEAIGLDSLWMVDHFQVDHVANARQSGREVTPEIEAQGVEGRWECWSMLSALAVATERVELGSLVTNTGYRNPALLAKIADTVDDISKGRLILGVGAGDFELEHHNYGFQWDNRIDRFEEALKIIRPLLRTRQVDFQGEHYAAHDAVLKPVGVRETGAPILIGALGHGPRMLRLTMEYADLWNAWIGYERSTPEALKPILERIDAACEKHGRDPATLERTVTVGVKLPGHAYPQRTANVEPITGSPEEIAEQLHAFAGLGISHIQIFLVPPTIEGLNYLAPAIQMLSNSAGR